MMAIYNCFECSNEFEEDMNIEVDVCPHCESSEFEMLECDNPDE